MLFETCKLLYCHFTNAASLCDLHMCCLLQRRQLCILGLLFSSKTHSFSLGELTAAPYLHLHIIDYCVSIFFSHHLPLFWSGVWSSSLDAQRICGSNGLLDVSSPLFLHSAIDIIWDCMLYWLFILTVNTRSLSNLTYFNLYCLLYNC